MNIDSIRKLLISEDENDNLLALNILRGRHSGNWGGFLIELDNICQGYFYMKDTFWRNKYGVGNQIQTHLWDKYFDIGVTRELRPHWYYKID